MDRLILVIFKTVDRAILIVRQSEADSDAQTTRGDAHKDDDW